MGSVNRGDQTHAPAIDDLLCWLAAFQAKCGKPYQLSKGSPQLQKRLREYNDKQTNARKNHHEGNDSIEMPECHRLLQLMTASLPCQQNARAQATQLHGHRFQPGFGVLPELVLALQEVLAKESNR
jgi:hypothetical protein